MSFANRLKPSFIASSLGNEYAARTYGFGPDTVEKQVPGTSKTETIFILVGFELGGS